MPTEANINIWSKEISIHYHLQLTFEFINLKNNKTKLYFQV